LLPRILTVFLQTSSLLWKECGLQILRWFILFNNNLSLTLCLHLGLPLSLFSSGSPRAYAWHFPRNYTATLLV
jgi:hypothetical protein